MQRVRKKRNEKDRKDGKILLFYLVCVIALLFAILITTGKMDVLKERIKKLTAREPEIMTESAKPIEKVRVVLLQEGNIYGKDVTLTSEMGLRVTAGESMELVPSVSFQLENMPWEKVIITAENQGTISLSNQGKTLSTVGYEGTIEVWKLPQGLVIVNEVPVESYLKGVVPSEMPQSYGLEALKAQAVCARSYVYVQAATENYPMVHAQLDDSTSYQVYNQQPHNDISNQAVDETKGQVVVEKDQVIETLYFSTSCGYTQTGSIFNRKRDDYLQSSYVGDHPPGEGFESYITHEDSNAYEGGEKYFRWKVTIDSDTYADSLVNKVWELHRKKPEEVKLSMGAFRKLEGYITAKNPGDRVAVASVFGKLTSMKCVKRNEGGVIEEIQLKFENGTLTVFGELNIRKILGSIMGETSFHDGSAVGRKGASPALYSGAFVWKKGEDNTFLLEGGGFGHGVGLSQNGAKAMSQNGKSYVEILTFFYKGVTVKML